MATKVSVTAGSGAGVLAEYEVSGGQSGSLYAGETFTGSVGVDGATIQFLTVRRHPKSSADLTVRAVDGPIEAEFDGKAKKVSKGGSVTAGAKISRVFIKEPVKR